MKIETSYSYFWERKNILFRLWTNPKYWRLGKYSDKERSVYEIGPLSVITD